MDFLQLSSKIKDELYSIREYLHAHPEIGNNEYNTTAFISEILHKYDIETVQVTDTGVIGILKGQSETTVGFRSDIDGLKIQEMTDCSFKSLNEGYMHGCGHDIHMTSLLGAAITLSKLRDKINGTIKFIFQPDEENNGGANRICKSGILDDCQTIFGLHVSSDLPLGKIGIRYGKFYASDDEFKLTIKGKGCHGAQPEKGHDPIITLANIIAEIHNLPEKMQDKAVLSIGKIKAGTSFNIIPDNAYCLGIIRTLSDEDRKNIKLHLKEVIEKYCQFYGCDYELEMYEGYPCLINDNDKTSLIKQYSLKMLSENDIIELKDCRMTSEDFGYYIRHCSGSFFHLGVGGKYPIHNAHFLPDNSSVIYGSAIIANLLFEYLKENGKK